MPADEDPTPEPPAGSSERPANPPADAPPAENPEPTKPEASVNAEADTSKAEDADEAGARGAKAKGADDADAEGAGLTAAKPEASANAEAAASKGKDADDVDVRGAGAGAAKAGGAKGDGAGVDDSAGAGAEAGKAVGGERRGVLVRAAGVLVLVAAVVTAGLQWYRADQAAREDSARRAVEEQAGEFGQALLSYDHRHLQDARNRVLGLASEDFAKTYDVAFTGGLEGVITKLKADASATVRSVYLGDVDESTARAIVVLDSEVRSSAGTRRVLGSHLDMRLVRKDGQWRVTEVTSIGAAQETMTDPEGRQQGGDGAALPTPGASPSE